MNENEKWYEVTTHDSRTGEIKDFLEATLTKENHLKIIIDLLNDTVDKGDWFKIKLVKQIDKYPYKEVYQHFIKTFLPFNDKAALEELKGIIDQKLNKM